MRVGATVRDGAGLWCTVEVNADEALPAQGAQVRRASDGGTWFIRDVDGPVALVDKRHVAIGSLVGILLDTDAGVMTDDELEVVAAAGPK